MVVRIRAGSTKDADRGAVAGTSSEGTRLALSAPSVGPATLACGQRVRTHLSGPYDGAHARTTEAITVTVGAAQDRGGAAVQDRPVRGGGRGVRTGQVLTTQVAAAVLVLGSGRGLPVLVAAGGLAVVLLTVTWLRLHGRWAYQWLSTATRFACRRHAALLDESASGLLEWVSPGARLVQTELAGAPTAVLVDGSGMTVLLELGDPGGLLVESLPALTSPVSLLPPAAPEHPPCRMQVVLTGVPAPAVRAGGGTPATSYRQLTDGRLLGHSRALLAVRVLRAEGWADDDLLRELSGQIRKLSRRLGGVPARPLGEAAAARFLAGTAHHADTAPVRENWSGLHLGGLAQTTLRVERWPDPRTETARRMVARMLALPATATTVALTVGPRGAGGPEDLGVTLTVRLAAADEAALAAATQALRRLLDTERAYARRLDGEHLDGLAATLPLGGGPDATAPGRRPAGGRAPVGLETLELPVGGAGLMLGNNRHGDPVVIRLFRPEQTRALVIGGVRCAQLIALRAMALGARVVVQTARPHAWDPFVRGAAVPGEAISVVAPGRTLEPPPGTELHPLLVVVDVGPVPPDSRPGAGWQATLVVRDELAAADVDVAGRADLLVMQPLRPDEAALAGSALGLGDAAQWLTRIRPDMVGLVNRRVVRWVALSATPIEVQLIGSPDRVRPGAETP